MGQDLVEIHPRELQFTFEVKKQSSCVVCLTNKSNEYVAFKVKTTSPKRYCVRPNTGVILPRKTCEFTVTMQALRTAPPDMQLKDKFLVQTTVVPYGTSDEELVPAVFSKETGRYIEESKLRVVLVSSYQSLEEQPTNGIHDTEPAVEVPLLKEMPNLGSEVPDVAKEIPAPLVQGPAIVTGIPSPVKEVPGLREIPVPLNEAPTLLAEFPSPQKDPSAITVEHASNVTIEHAPAISIESPPLKQSVPVFKESPLKQSVAVFKESPPLKQSISVFKESPPLEETTPKEAVMLSDRGLFNVQNHQLSHVTEDVQNMKSKLNNLESKLEEAEKMIIRLREESRNTTQERDELQQEMVFLRKKGTARSQMGFPLLFVVYVALLGTCIGYLLRI
ncbi:Vesicle-associated protein 2-2 [Zea mays]|uniref:VAP27-2 n=3 Tax=Zea mays TaxID=4577 RepID=B6TRX1_MAIZE|nr:VAP27-2 [Zea mays]ONM34736.1 VAP27-2 [Zea mays]PWZ34285.1 Vesicle-associated protein 2-2 [Zea mays]